MFDDIVCDAMRCPLCGQEMGWQSKDGPCTLETLTVHELMDETSKPVFYANCDDCQVWVEVSVTRRDERTPAQWAQYRKEREIIDNRKKAWDKPKEEGGTWDEEAFLLKPKDPHYLRGFLDYEPPADQPPKAEDPGIDMDACWINGCTCGRPKPKRESPVPGYPACQCHHGRGYHHALAGRCTAKVGTQLRCDCNAYRAGSVPPHPTTFVLSREEIENPPPDPVQEISKRRWQAFFRKEHEDLARILGTPIKDCADPVEDVQ